MSLAYAAYQALPAKGESPLLRRVGPFTAAAFFCTGLWSVFVPLRQFGLAQLMLLAIFLCLLIAYLRLSRYAHECELGVGERWLVALPLWPFLGWVTAASAVSLTAEAVRRGLVAPGGASEAVLGSALLLVGSHGKTFRHLTPSGKVRGEYHEVRPHRRDYRSPRRSGAPGPTWSVGPSGIPSWSPPPWMAALPSARRRESSPREGLQPGAPSPS